MNKKRALPTSCDDFFSFAIEDMENETSHKTFIIVNDVSQASIRLRTIKTVRHDVTKAPTISSYFFFFFIIYIHHIQDWNTIF